MSQNSTLARPYAKAVFELAESQKKLTQWSDMLQVAASIAEDERVIALMKDPKFSAQELEAFFLDIGKGKFTEEAQNLITILGGFKRLAYLPEIAALFEEYKSVAEQVVNVELTSAFPVSDEERKRFVDALKRRMNRDIVLECVTDKTILGGAIIRAGDLVIDGSIRGKLAKLGEAMGIS